MPVAEKTSNRPAATKSSRTTLLSSFKRLSVQSRRTAHAVLGSVANTPYFFLEHFLSDGDYGRDRTIKARSRLLLIGNYPGLQHEISHVRTSLFKSRIKAENSRPYHLRTPGKTARAAQSVMLCRIFGGVHTEKTLTYRGEAAALIVLALPCSL